MPVCIPINLPASEILADEGVFVMDESRAKTQDIRPLKILIINLMPRKEVTETQLLRMLSNTPLQVVVHFLRTTTHDAKNVDASHLREFYKSFDQVQSDFYDAMIVTGAPVETLDFEQVDYWRELTEIFDWADTHVFSTLHICWGAQAGLYHRYGIEKFELSGKGDKLTGVFDHVVRRPNSPLLRGLNPRFLCPHSRYTKSSMIFGDSVRDRWKDLELLAHIDYMGPAIVASTDLRRIYHFGHPEYDLYTLDFEYRRDFSVDRKAPMPVNYYRVNAVERVPVMSWSSDSNLFFANWLNVVYQRTPYDAREIANLV